MISFGMMSLTLNSELSYFTEIARQANPSLFTCYRFAPTSIQPLSQLVKGERFDNKQDKWVKEEFPIPEILYDRCFYSDDPLSKQSMAIVRWLKSRSDKTFLGTGLPNKWAIYEALSTSSLSPYVPETIKATDGKMVVSQLRKWKRSVLKPAFGSGGAGIYSIKKDGREYIAAADFSGKMVQKHFKTESETEDWLNRLFNKKEYLMQPYLELTDAQNCPFDIRILLQKDMTGTWTVRGKGIRRGREAGIISNLSAGGEILAFDDFAESLSIKTKKFILHELDDILSKLPEILEASFPKLFELGVDIGLSQDHALWVLDTNSKPGRKVIAATNPEMKEILYKAPLDYAFFLTKILTEREEQHS